jgi:hypothetical protein
VYIPSAAFTLNASIPNIIYMSTAYAITLGTNASGQSFVVATYPTIGSLVIPSGITLYRGGTSYTNQTISLGGLSQYIFTEVNSTTWFCQ